MAEIDGITTEELKTKAESSGDEGGSVPRGEKKARKLFLKLGLKQVKDIDKVEMRRSRQFPVSIYKPMVFEVPGKVPSYIVLGQLKIDDFREQLAKQAKLLQAQQQQQQLIAQKKTTPTIEEEDVDCGDLDMKDIKLAMEQTGKSKSEVVNALRKHNGDLIEAIMQLS